MERGGAVSTSLNWEKVCRGIHAHDKYDLEGGRQGIFHSEHDVGSGIVDDVAPQQGVKTGFQGCRYLRGTTGQDARRY